MSVTAVLLAAPRPARVLLLVGCFLFPAPVLVAQEPEQMSPAEVQALTDVYLAPGQVSGLPLVQPNDNRVRAGSMAGEVYEVSLEIHRSDWRIESAAGPGLRVAAMSETGGLPMIPAPLLRADAGTAMRVSVTNQLEGPVQVIGLHDRDGREAERLPLAPGESQTVEWVAHTAGTFQYFVVEEVDNSDLPAAAQENGVRREREQLAGALVVDAPGAPTDDRIMVINIFSEPVIKDGEIVEFPEALTINGRSWPYTERMQMEVGRTERWRVLNASRRNHPMHLHGFYFDVLSRGTVAADTIYAPEDQRLVVTEFMRGRSTMLMEWTPTRPGSWLFHCHLSFHVADFVRLPGAREADPEHAHSHMAGLVLGIEVAPGPTDLIVQGPVEQVHLRAMDASDDDVHEFRFVRDGTEAEAGQDVPGPLLVFNQYTAADVTVENTMGQSTGIHWHGLELDGWADGVPDWSASDGRVSPQIHPGESFTYRLSFMRPGTFMYHTHMNDIEQLSGGLYGPLIVLPPGETLDPERDHVKIVSWNTPNPQGPQNIDLNGGRGEPDIHAAVGEVHRFRLMHIAPAGQLSGWVTRAGDEEEMLPVRLIAKDGADLPPSQQIEVESVPRIGVGETADFTFAASEPGEYVIHVGRPGRFSHTQRFIVRAGEAPDAVN